MARHIKSSSSSKIKEEGLNTKTSLLEETINSKNLSDDRSIPNVPLINDHTLETKLFESEAKISKLISEIDLLKTKVG